MKWQLQRSKPCDVVECLGHFDRIVPSLADSLACMLTKQHGIRSGKYLLKTISETLNFKMSQDASALKNLCLWCKFQSCLLFIISLLLKNVLTALVVGSFSAAVVSRQMALSDMPGCICRIFVLLFRDFHGHPCYLIPFMFWATCIKLIQ